MKKRIKHLKSAKNGNMHIYNKSIGKWIKPINESGEIKCLSKGINASWKNRPIKMPNSVMNVLFPLMPNNNVTRTGAYSYQINKPRDVSDDDWNQAIRDLKNYILYTIRWPIRRISQEWSYELIGSKGEDRLTLEIADPIGGYIELYIDTIAKLVEVDGELFIEVD